MIFLKRKSDEGPYLGYFVENGRVKGSVHYRGPKHLLTIGPPGSSKTVSVIVQNVASLRRSMVIIDTKCQICPITFRARSRMGPTLVLNPFGMFADALPFLKDRGYNPLPALDPASPRFADGTRSYAAQRWLTIPFSETSIARDPALTRRTLSSSDAQTR